MRFAPTTAALVLAFTSSAAGAPQLHRRHEATTIDRMLIPKSTDSASPASDTKRSADLSVTQQLLRADLAAERFEILKNDTDFKYPLWPGDIPKGRGGVLKAANRKTFPALVGTKGAMAVRIVKPCGVNTFHVHPRSAELQMVISGQLVAEMVAENGVRPIRNTINPFEMMPFYQGSVHHQFNPKCDDAIFIAAFPTEDPGTGQVVNELFELDKGAIVDTLGGSIDREMANKIKLKLPETIVQGVETCLKECGGKVASDNGKGESEDKKGDSKRERNGRGRNRDNGGVENGGKDRGVSDIGNEIGEEVGGRLGGDLTGDVAGEVEDKEGGGVGTKAGSKVGAGQAGEYDGDVSDDADFGYDVAHEIGDEVGAEVGGEVGGKIGGEIGVSPDEGEHWLSKHWVVGRGPGDFDDDVVKEIGSEVGRKAGGAVGGGIGGAAPAGGHLPSDSSSSWEHTHYSH